MRTLYLLVAVALVASCTKGDDTGGSDTDTDTDADLPDPLDGLESFPSCDDFQFGEPPQYVGAATAYLAGDYNRTGDDMAGLEYWYFIPNDCLALQDENWDQDTPCTLVWDVFADVNDDPDCTGCIMEITGEAFTNEGASDCPPIGGWADNAFTYHVRAGENDGEVRMYFPSGTEFATGLFNDSGLVWTGFGSCALLGDSTGCN